MLIRLIKSIATIACTDLVFIVNHNVNNNISNNIKSRNYRWVNEMKYALWSRLYSINKSVHNFICVYYLLWVKLLSVNLKLFLRREIKTKVRTSMMFKSCNNTLSIVIQKLIIHNYFFPTFEVSHHE